MSYRRFLAMIITSTVVMFFLMYSTAYKFEHAYWSQTRFWMAIYMGATMAVIMLSFMLSMYEDRRKNIAIFAGAAVLIVGGLFFARSQATIDDVGWMSAMIPHHSIAILTSERASISDPRVRKLADDIILAQRAEIAEMEALIEELDDVNLDGEPIPPSVKPVTGGDARVSGAPSLSVGENPVRGDVVIIEQTKTESDAWVVLHPVGVDGQPDLNIVLGHAFLLHGTNHRIPVSLTVGAESAESIVAMLHDDTGEIGRFEFGVVPGADMPLMAEGKSVTATVEQRL